MSRGPGLSPAFTVGGGMDTESAMWAAVGAAPGDRLPRLVLADWLEENAGTVRCPRRCQYAGDVGRLIADPECGTCEGYGRIADPDWEDAEDGPVEAPCVDCPDCKSMACPVCSGEGYVSDGRAELAESLRATADRVPTPGVLRGYYGWGDGGEMSAYGLPRSLFGQLSGETRGWTFWRWYPTAEAAIRDLCRAWVNVHHRTRIR